jgi:hypothetical protein
MSYSTEFLLKARLELSEAWEWYGDKQQDLGDKFKKKVYYSVEIIEHEPERYPERRKRYLGALIKIFPYLVVYLIHNLNHHLIPNFLFRFKLYFYGSKEIS